MKKLLSTVLTGLTLSLMTEGAHSMDSRGMAYNVLTGAVKVEGFKGTLFVNSSEAPEDNGKVFVKLTTDNPADLKHIKVGNTEDLLWIQDKRTLSFYTMTLTITVPKGGRRCSIPHTRDHKGIRGGGYN